MQGKYGAFVVFLPSSRKVAFLILRTDDVHINVVDAVFWRMQRSRQHLTRVVNIPSLCFCERA
jgi:hypothetical protein